MRVWGKRKNGEDSGKRTWRTNTMRVWGKRGWKANGSSRLWGKRGDGAENEMMKDVIDDEKRAWDRGQQRIRGKRAPSPEVLSEYIFFSKYRMT